MPAEIEIRRLGEQFDAVERVEAAGEAARQLEMLLLVFAYRHFRGLLYEDVDSHKSRIGQQAGVDALVGLIADNFRFDILVGSVFRDSELLARLVLERGRAHKLADADMHVHKQIKLRNLGNIALDKDCGFFRIDTGGEILGNDIMDIAVEHLRVGMRCQSVEVGDEEQTVEVVLHPDEFTQGAEVITKMKVSGCAYAA